MNFLWGFVAGWWACTALVWALVISQALSKRKTPPPTKAKRKQPIAQGENGDVDYSWINVAGERE